MSASTTSDTKSHCTVDSAPPPYTPLDTNPATCFTHAELSPEALDELKSALTSISLHDKKALCQDRALAHLKLLFAFQQLKIEIGYSDGLWQLFDSMALPARLKDKGSLEMVQPNTAQADRINKDLARIREKRWALFVARAVDRYETWWNTFRGVPLKEDQGTGKLHFYNFAQAVPMKWNQTMLPPLDVIMVWHTHMLNPRNYLEDCLRAGFTNLWAAGMPWEVINTCIDNSTFAYSVSRQCEASWYKKTAHAWLNTEDKMNKLVKCLACSATNRIPWTTCGKPEDSKSQPYMDLQGHGFGDGRLNHRCQGCSNSITSDLLEVQSFVNDFKRLVDHNHPMPGTILSIATGVPRPADETQRRADGGPTFPNKLLKDALRYEFQNLLSHIGPVPTHPTLETIRKLIQDALFSKEYLEKTGMKQGRVSRAGKIHIRQMMSRYWQNRSPFALDLAGAVYRQGVFVEKMYKIDWLHSPSARQTMTRLIAKYKRFIKIIADNPRHIAVPTLDVDLAWHTQQLSPQEYYNYTIDSVKKFLDHNDKIEDLKLHDAFAWTTKEYQMRYKEVYSECTCWYCETIRTSQISTVMAYIGTSTTEKISEAFHKSSQAQLCPTDKSAHISAHNSVSLNDIDRLRHEINVRRRNALIHRLCQDHKKAEARAEKKKKKEKNRKTDDDASSSSQDDKHYHWGYAYYAPIPYAGPVSYDGSMYAGGNPSECPSGRGGPGGCVNASCAPAAVAGACAYAAGGCGGAGGCTTRGFNVATTGGCGAVVRSNDGGGSGDGDGDGDGDGGCGGCGCGG